MPGHVNAALASYGELACDGRAAAAVYGHRGGLQLALHSQGGDLRLRRGRPRRGRGADARAVPAHRGRRAAVDRPRRLPLLRRARAAASCRARGSGRSAGRRSRARHFSAPRSCSNGTTDSRRLAVRQAAESSMLSPATRAYLDMKYTRSSELGLVWAGDGERPQGVRMGPGHRDRRRRRAGRPRRGGAPLVGDDREAQGPRPPGLPPAPRRCGDRLVAGGRALVAGLPNTSRAHGPRLDSLGVGFHRATEVPWAEPVSGGR